MNFRKTSKGGGHFRFWVSKHHGGYIITDGFGKNVVDTIPKVEEIDARPKNCQVLELAGLAPAPVCGMILADHGADVLRIDKVNIQIFGHLGQEHKGGLSSCRGLAIVRASF